MLEGRDERRGVFCLVVKAPEADRIGEEPFALEPSRLVEAHRATLTPRAVLALIRGCLRADTRVCAM